MWRTEAERGKLLGMQGASQRSLGSILCAAILLDYVFRHSQCGMDGVMLEVSGHKAAVVVTRVTEKRTVTTEV